MNNRNKVLQLRNKIYESLGTLVTTDFVYLDTPHHFNCGDTLIWEGTLEFIRNIDHACRYIANANSFTAEKAINWCSRHQGASTILLHGGGNFGDLWPLHQKFRNEVITKCTDIPIIILPQTIYYQNRETLIRDAELYKGKDNITICVRDNVSLEIAREFFPDCNPILVPDMAFCINLKRSDIPVPSQENLFVKRTDKEISTSVHYDSVPIDATVSDWPTMAPTHPLQHYHPSLLDWCTRVDCRLGTKLSNRLNNYYWNMNIRKRIVEEAISFIGDYRSIYTTRMHAAILSVLLDRSKTVLFDNSYGKSSSFADAWFSDLDNFELCRQ